jgi:hypothetical protein
MRMYLILAIPALLVVALLVFSVRLLTAVRSTQRDARKREAVAARLAPVVEQAAKEHQARNAAAQASAALTTVLPAIQPGDRGPRRVA